MSLKILRSIRCVLPLSHIRSVPVCAFVYLHVRDIFVILIFKAYFVLLTRDGRSVFSTNRLTNISYGLYGRTDGIQSHNTYSAPQKRFGRRRTGPHRLTSTSLE